MIDLKKRLINIMLGTAVATLALGMSCSCSQKDDYECGKDLLEINKKYDEMSLRAQEAGGDLELLKEIYKAKLHAIEALDCY